MVASPSVHSTPTPSPPQNVPNDISISATENLIVFSGTWLSGRWTFRPTRPTMTKASRAPAALSAQLLDVPELAPNVRTINATSRPSRKTPLNETTKPVQSNSVVVVVP